MEATERRALVLQAVVDLYVATAQPIGSQTIAQSPNVAVSSATVRNDMTILERDGYLAQPHTSAGRIPTDLGYRFFVDNLNDLAPLAPLQRREISDFFTSANHALEDLLAQTSQLLAGITRHAAVVMAPQAVGAEVRSVQVVELQPNSVVVVAVLSNAAVETVHLHLDAGLSPGGLHSVTQALEEAFVGNSLAELPVPKNLGNPELDGIAVSVRDILAGRSAATPTPLYVGGVSRLAAEQNEFSTAEGAAKLLEMLEQQVVMVSLVRRLFDGGVNVSIGAENEIDELRDCSLIIAPYQVDGEHAGTVGILGPTRMDYRQALAAVTAVSEQLGTILS